VLKFVKKEGFLIISQNYLLQSEIKDNNDFIESSLTIRDVPNSAPAETQIRQMSSTSPLTDSCNWKPL